MKGSDSELARRVIKKLKTVHTPPAPSIAAPVAVRSGDLMTFRVVDVTSFTSPETNADLVSSTSLTVEPTLPEIEP